MVRMFPVNIKSLKRSMAFFAFSQEAPAAMMRTVPQSRARGVLIARSVAGLFGI